jgi:hypothetical protein
MYIYSCKILFSHLYHCFILTLNLQIHTQKNLAQNNPISHIEREQLSKVNKTLSLKVKPKPKSQPKIQTRTFI